MSHFPHELAEEYPEHVDPIHTLKTTKAHFAMLFDDYHELNWKIHLSETDVEPTNDERMADMRRRRLAMKDEVYEMLKQA